MSRKGAQRRRGLGIVAPLLAALAVFLLVGMDPLGRLAGFEAAFLDARLKHFAAPTAFSERIVILDLSEDSLGRMEPMLGRWPWPRSVHAEVLDYLRAEGAAAVAYDIIFSERTRRVQLDEQTLGDLELFAANADLPEVRQELAARLKALAPRREDERFVRSVEELGAFFTPAVFYVDEAEADRTPELAGGEDERRETVARLAKGAVHGSLVAPASRRFYRATVPFPELARAAAGVGHVQIVQDADGVVRRVRPFAQLVGASAATPALPLAVAAHVLGVEPAAVAVEDGALRLGPHTLPLEADGTLRIPFHGPADIYAVRPYDLALGSALMVQAGREPLLPPGFFTDKVVIMGASAIGLKDVHATPMSPVTTSAVIHAQVLDAAVSGQGLVSAPRGAVLAGLALVCLAAALAGARSGALTGLGLTLSLAGATVYASWRLFALGLAAPMAAPLACALLAYLAGAVLRVAAQGREKRELKNAFGQYLAPDVMEEVLAHPERLKLGGEKRELTVLFSDLAGFTTLAENLSPEAVSGMLNSYFNAMVQAVFDTGGIVDKFIGDALMAEWNTPKEQPDHAARACRAALAMRAAMDALRADWTARGLPAPDMRIGVNTGEMVVGNMGAEKVFDYTVIGNEVNTASRLEALNKELGAAIIVAASTRDAALEAAGAKDLGPGNFRKLGKVLVKGRTTPLVVYELVQSQPDGNAFGLFEKAVESFMAGAYAEALRGFQELRNVLPGDGPTERYTALCRAYLQAPPPPERAGVLPQETK